MSTTRAELASIIPIDHQSLTKTGVGIYGLSTNGIVSGRVGRSAFPGAS